MCENGVGKTGVVFPEATNNSQLDCYLWLLDGEAGALPLNPTGGLLSPT